MNEPIFSPLDYYVNEGKKLHENNVNEYYRLLLEHANVDAEANAATVDRYHTKLKEIDSLEKDVAKSNRLRNLFIVGIVVAFLVLAVLFNSYSRSSAEQSIKTAAALIAGVVGVYTVCKRTSAKVKLLTSSLDEKRETADALLEEANKQMAPLHALFSDFDALNLFSKTLPFVSFDAQFNQTRLNELTNEYGYSDRSDPNESVTDVISGELYGDPFLFEQKLIHSMGTHVYTGSLTISWTTTERDRNGNTVTERHSQTLTARVVKPKPYYQTDVELHYGNEAAPELCFSRTCTHAEDKSEAALARKIRSGEKKLRRAADKSLRSGGNFTEMVNTEFEVLFGAMDRNDDLQFRQAFTPLAQESILKLILSDEGYGDDFSFVKRGKLNTIRSEHSNRAGISTSASQYCTYSLAQTEKQFKAFHNEFFKKLYFDLAPILAIPLYKEYAMIKNTTRTGMLTRHVLETVANKLSEELSPRNAATYTVFKANVISQTNNVANISINARAYTTQQRVDFVSVRGRDGYFHDVPVYWTEYIPIEQNSTLLVAVSPDGTPPPNVPKNAFCYRGVYAYLG